VVLLTKSIIGLEDTIAEKRTLFMSINYHPKTGAILECEFGDFKVDESGVVDNTYFDGHVPPEMVKNRLVVVLNGKLGGSCLVVPISSKQHLGSIAQGRHVLLKNELFDLRDDFYDDRDRWAKAELIQPVSRFRLFRLKDGTGGRYSPHLDRDSVELIQRSVIKSISAMALLK
jgi:uncharacterized protein YifN (PemK superfamily)